MIHEQTGTGATIEEAKEAALAQLAAPDDIIPMIETLQLPKKGFLGLKKEPAIVRAWYETEDPKPAEAPKKREGGQPKKDQQPKKEQPKKDQQPRKEQQPKKDQQPKNEQPKKEQQPKKEAAQPKEEEHYVDLPVNEDDAAVKFLRTVLKGMKIEDAAITLQKSENGSEYIYTVDCGEDNRVLIGRRGETLDAIQYLLRLTENKGVNEDKHRKLTVNVGDYREKRSQNLKSEAQRAARQALKYGKNVGLEPMSPYERRIIHTTIQGIEGVTSHSVGSESNRRVIVSLEEGVTPTNPGRGGYGNNRGRSGGGRRDGGRAKREPYKPAVTREPRKDSAGALYGKIEIPVKKEEEE